MASGTSIIEHSSAISTSHSRGLSALRLNWPLSGLTSSRRWMVFASNPVDSPSRLAARPVGAQSSGLTPLTLMIVRMELTRVVLPTPGPPVITSSFADKARRIASFWLSANSMASFCSTQGIALSAAKSGRVEAAVVRRRTWAAIDCSA